MEVKQIVERIKAVMPDVTEEAIEVQGADCDFSVTVVSDTFEGLMPVKRQQMVLAGFSDVLASGELHALSVKAKTFAEIEQALSQSAGLVQLEQ